MFEKPVHYRNENMRSIKVEWDGSEGGGLERTEGKKALSMDSGASVSL